MCHVFHVTCHTSPVTKPTDNSPASFLIMHSRLVWLDQKPEIIKMWNKIYKTIKENENMCAGRPTLALHPMTRCLQYAWKWGFRNGTGNHTHPDSRASKNWSHEVTRLCKSFYNLDKTKTFELKTGITGTIFMFLTQSDKVLKKIICLYSIFCTSLCAKFCIKNSDYANKFAFRRSNRQTHKRTLGRFSNKTEKKWWSYLVECLFSLELPHQVQFFLLL